MCTNTWYGRFVFTVLLRMGGLARVEWGMLFILNYLLIP